MPLPVSYAENWTLFLRKNIFCRPFLYYSIYYPTIPRFVLPFSHEKSKQPNNTSRQTPSAPINHDAVRIPRTRGPAACPECRRHRASNRRDALPSSPRSAKSRSRFPVGRSRAGPCYCPRCRPIRAPGRPAAPLPCRAGRRKKYHLRDRELGGPSRAAAQQRHLVGRRLRKRGLRACAAARARGRY